MRSLAAWTFVDFVIDSTADPAMEKQLLPEFIWRLHYVPFEHVILGLVRGNRDDGADKGFALFDHLFDKSSEFHTRYDFWISPDVGRNPRYWLEEDGTTKLDTYFKRYPEYYDFEAPLKTETKPADPPLAQPLPIYHSCVLTRTLPFLDLAIGKLIEFEKADILIRVLTHYPKLYHHHSAPLSFVHDTLFYYANSPLLRDPAVVRALVGLLDLSQYPFSPEFVTAFSPGSADTGDYLSVGYFSRLVKRLTEHLGRDHLYSEPLSSVVYANYREVVNPMLQALLVTTIEVMAGLHSPKGPEGEHPLLMAVLRSSGPLTQDTAIAFGLLMANLPEAFRSPLSTLAAETILNHPFLQLPTGPSPSALAELLQAPGAPSRQAGAEGITTNPFMSGVFAPLEASEDVLCSSLPTRLLAVLHAMFHFSSLDTVTEFREILEQARQASAGQEGGSGIRTDTQLFFLCRLLGPSLVRLAKDRTTSSRLFAELVSDLFFLLRDLGHLFSEGQGSFALDGVVDFLMLLKIESPAVVDAVIRQQRLLAEFVRSKPQLRFFLEM